MSTAGMLPLECEIIPTSTEPLEVHNQLLCLSCTFELVLFDDNSSRFGIFSRSDPYLCIYENREENTLPLNL